MHRKNLLLSGSLVVAVMMLSGKCTGHVDELQSGPLSFLHPSQNATVNLATQSTLTFLLLE